LIGGQFRSELPENKKKIEMLDLFNLFKRVTESKVSVLLCLAKNITFNIKVND